MYAVCVSNSAAQVSTRLYAGRTSSAQRRSRTCCALAPSSLARRRSEKPADNAAYEIYKRLHSYDKTELKSSTDSTDDSSPYWRSEKVSFQAAYGNERVIAYLYLPKNAEPPYQVVTFFPGANTLVARTIADARAVFEPGCV